MPVLFAAVFVIPAVFLLSGVIMQNHFSQWPDVSAGYHLGPAVKDRQTWEEANRYAGRYCIRSSVGILIVDALVLCLYLFGNPLFTHEQWEMAVFGWLGATFILQFVLLFVLPLRHLKKTVQS